MRLGETVSKVIEQSLFRPGHRRWRILIKCRCNPSLGLAPRHKTVAAFLRAQRVAWRMTCGTVPRPESEIAPPVPYIRLFGHWLEPITVEKQQIPPGHQRTDIERERQVGFGRGRFH